jgi:hypothetical protein
VGGDRNVVAAGLAYSRLKNAQQQRIVDGWSWLLSTATLSVGGLYTLKISETSE